MKNTILLIAVASVFALASCGGGEKHEETTTVDTTAVSTADTSAAVADTATTDSTSMAKDSATTAPAAH